MAKDSTEVAQGSREIEPEAIHGWFELSYAQYLTLPRTALQSMPEEWQTRFVACLRELDESFDWRPREGNQFWVQMRGPGHFIKLAVYEPFMDYKRGRRRVLRWQEAYPCVHCGSNAEIRFIGRSRSSGRYRLECIRCAYCIGMARETVSEAITVWNKPYCEVCKKQTATGTWRGMNVCDECGDQ